MNAIAVYVRLRFGINLLFPLCPYPVEGFLQRFRVKFSKNRRIN
jgi:hypothetical protein